jgi:RNA polymerase sigma-70 factor (ECF subfamily)
MAMATAARRSSVRGDETDQQLLERFVHEGEQRAFTALVRRHGSVVLAVCRQVLRHEQDAEDATQGTFLVLARKANRVSWQPSVRSWLCAVAYRLALNARTPVHETTSGTGDEWEPLEVSAHPIPLAQIEEREIREIVNEELRRLPKTYRDPVVLCYLEGKTNREAARLLGWPQGSMARRLARARQLLRERLIQRGLIITVILLAAAWMSGTFDSKRPPAHGAGMETTLFRLTGYERSRDAQPTAVLEVAKRAGADAQALERHDPGAGRSAWRTHSEEMRRAAVALAEAVEQNDDPATVLAARRLHTTCVSCHKAFRR